MKGVYKIMIQLDTFNEEIISLKNAERFLSQAEYERFITIPEKERACQLNDILNFPISKFTEVNELFFRSKWANLFNRLYLKKPIKLLEIASGDADMIPQALDISNPQSTYITANMNKILNQSLLSKTKNLKLKLELIDDDAANIKSYISESSVDMITFQHGVNDVLQAIICGKYGVDTVFADWMEILPEMIRLLNKELSENTFEQTVKSPFLQLMDNLRSLLTKDGIIAINHYMFQLDLDLGYPKNLFENLVPIIREWFREAGDYEELEFDGFNKQWWIFLKNKSL